MIFIFVGDCNEFSGEIKIDPEARRDEEHNPFDSGEKIGFPKDVSRHIVNCNTGINITL